jgi:hypothetical protein
MDDKTEHNAFGAFLLLLFLDFRHVRNSRQDVFYTILHYFTRVCPRYTQHTA